MKVTIKVVKGELAQSYNAQAMRPRRFPGFMSATYLVPQCPNMPLLGGRSLSQINGHSCAKSMSVLAKCACCVRPQRDSNMPGYIRRFKELRLSDIPLVGGKTASLGEMYNALSLKGIRVPDGFAITESAYRDALNQAGAWNELNRLLEDLRTAAVRDLAKRAASAREIVYRATGTDDIRDQIFEAYRRLELEYGRNPSVAIRSSATAEDLPNASFAGQH